MVLLGTVASAANAYPARLLTDGIAEDARELRDHLPDMALPATACQTECYNHYADTAMPMSACP